LSSIGSWLGWNQRYFKGLTDICHRRTRVYRIGCDQENRAESPVKASPAFQYDWTRSHWPNGAIEWEAHLYTREATYARVYVHSLANRHAGKNMEVGQIVGELSGPPSRYCDAIIHHKLSTQGQFAPNDRPIGCLFPHAVASLYASSSSFFFPLPATQSSHLLACMCTLRNDAPTCNTRDRMTARYHLRARTNVRLNGTFVRREALLSTLKGRKNRLNYVAAASPTRVYDSNAGLYAGTTLLHKRGISVAATTKLC